MNNINIPHTFHIPVMGIGFTIDTPLKVAHYGISSVISLVDDILIEKMREFYCNKLGLPFESITKKMDDFRAKRITAYLDLMDKLVKEKFEEVKESVMEKGSEIEKYLSMLPDYSELKKRFNRMVQNNINVQEFQNWLHNNLVPGTIDVNIMTKLDKDNYKDKKLLPQQYKDAHAALRGFANSKLESSIIFSAGMNPKLYGYIENFDDFYPNESGYIKKKIVIKISDYRSALIQGKFLAKKGLWVSEFRVESGLNCGGHAFATDGYLLGPILEEIDSKRGELISEMYDLFAKSLKTKERFLPEQPPIVKFTAQGGIGTSEEHEFLLKKYNLDSVGWGTPFLLVPEVTNVDKATLELLSNAQEEDLYLSKISPIGIPFNTVKGNSKDEEKEALIETGRPGSKCPKKFLSLNFEFTDKAICTASRLFQYKKIKELESKDLSEEDRKNEYKKITVKSCICVGLGTSVLLNNNMDTKTEGPGVSVCPGPNMAYFSEIVSLRKMVDHIYGRVNIINREDRPNFFIKELGLYFDYLKEKIAELNHPVADNQIKQLETFRNNMLEGIQYYRGLFGNAHKWFADKRNVLFNELDRYEQELSNMNFEFVPDLFLEKAE